MTFGSNNRKIGPKGDFGPKSAPFRKSDQKVKVGLSVADTEPGSAASGPDRIHAQPGLPELVAFSVPLHSNIGHPPIHRTSLRICYIPDELMDFRGFP